MEEGTACMWLEMAEFNRGQSTPLSYAVNDENNEWVVWFTDTETLQTVVGGNTVNTPADIPLWSQRSGDFGKVGIFFA